MTGQGFNSTYNPFKQDSSAEKESDPYSTQVGKPFRPDLSSRKRQNLMKNIRIFDSKSRSNSKSAKKRIDDSFISRKTKTSNWLFSKKRQKSGTAIPGERKKKYRSQFMAKRINVSRGMSRE